MIGGQWLMGEIVRNVRQYILDYQSIVLCWRMVADEKR
jgi:hypothetical protein